MKKIEPLSEAEIKADIQRTLSKLFDRERIGKMSEKELKVFVSDLTQSIYIACIQIEDVGFSSLNALEQVFEVIKKQLNIKGKHIQPFEGQHDFIYEHGKKQ